MKMIRYLPLAILVALLVILVILEALTYYLGRPSVTFERYMGEPVPRMVRELGLRRYRANHSPHLFDMTVLESDEEQLIDNLTRHCQMTKSVPRKLLRELANVDAEMVDVINQSPYLYATKDYDEHNVTARRLCVLFRDKKRLYLFLYGDL